MRTLILLALLALLTLPTPAHAEQSQCLTAAASRYAGETERHLSHTFALAAQSDVILQVDEADALFGRRSNVQDAHDRYANADTSYLLARIEHFGGLETLTSNMRQTLVAGFDRRSRNAGLILIRTDTGVRVLEFSRAERSRALAYARETLRACPPQKAE